MDDLINKCRPNTFDEIIGESQGKACTSIVNALNKKRGRTFLLEGPSGVGKTTIGRLIAKHVGCDAMDLIEIDGATTTGIDAMREVVAHLPYRLSGGARVVIVDECHAISAAAFKSILKALEEPPEGVYWVLCTTELAKVPKAVQTRCLIYHLQLVPDKTMRVFVRDVAKMEKLAIRRSQEARRVIVAQAAGSPRMALALLAQCGDLTDADEVVDLCAATGEGSVEAIDLCRKLMGVTPWRQICSCLSGIEQPAETVRLVVLKYMTTVVLKGSKIERPLAIMEEFSEPFVEREGKAPLVLACARLVLVG